MLMMIFAGNEPKDGGWGRGGTIQIDVFVQNETFCCERLTAVDVFSVTKMSLLLSPLSVSSPHIFR